MWVKLKRMRTCTCGADKSFALVYKAILRMNPKSTRPFHATIVNAGIASRILLHVHVIVSLLIHNVTFLIKHFEIFS